MASRRSSVSLVADELAECFECLPQAKNEEELVSYKNLNFKRAPGWADIAPYRHCLLKILVHTKGSLI